MSDNYEVLLENLVFLELRRCYENIYYYKTKNNLEVDFLVYNQPNKAALIQVTWSLANPKTKQREIASTLKAMEELNLNEALMLTEGESDTLKFDNKVIRVMPVYQWLLKNKKITG